MYSSYTTDRHFIEFWKSISKFFAYYVILARKYSQFYNNEEFLLEYLRQRGLLICDNETFANLEFLLHNYYSEIRKRGTVEVTKRYLNLDVDESDSNSSSDSNYINGEMLRTICFDECDEFIFNFRKIEKLGWNIGNSSPLYRGLSNQDGVNKIWTKLLTAINYLEYPLFGSVTTFQENDESDSDSNSDALISLDYVLKISNGTSGFGLDNVSSYTLAYILQYAINVDVNIDYEFSFRIKTDLIEANSLNFGVNAFDCEGNVEDLVKITDLSASVEFVSNDELNKIDKYYLFRGIIYSKNRFLLHDGAIVYKKDITVRDGSNNFYISLSAIPIGIPIGNSNYWKPLSTDEANSLKLISWNRGQNLQFTDDVKKIIPYIKVINSNANSHIFVADVRLQPVATNYSAGFISTPQWIDIWLHNNNGFYTYADLKELFRRYLLPYGAEFEFNQLEETDLP